LSEIVKENLLSQGKSPFKTISNLLGNFLDDSADFAENMHSKNV